MVSPDAEVPSAVVPVSISQDSWISSWVGCGMILVFGIKTPVPGFNDLLVFNFCWIRLFNWRIINFNWTFNINCFINGLLSIFNLFFHDNLVFGIKTPVPGFDDLFFYFLLYTSLIKSQYLFFKSIPYFVTYLQQKVDFPQLIFVRYRNFLREM